MPAGGTRFKRHRGGMNDQHHGVGSVAQVIIDHGMNTAAENKIIYVLSYNGLSIFIARKGLF